MIDDNEPVSRRPTRPLSLLGIGVIVGTLVLDQMTKALAERYLEYGQQIDLLPILSLYRVYNTGIAFSLLAGAGTVGLVVLAAAVTLLVLLIWHRTTEGGPLVAIGYALIIGGALGNLTDRLVYGHVVDFLLLHLGAQPLFVFNLADAALTAGPALLILLFLLPDRRSKDRNP